MKIFNVLSPILLAVMITLIGLVAVNQADSVAVAPSPTPIFIASPTPISELSASQIFEEVQIWRESMNLPRYIWDESLCPFANQRAHESYDKWSHDGFNAARACGTKYNCYAGENLARDFTTAKDAVTSWLNSPKHRENLGNDYVYSCIGQYKGNFAQIFMKY